MTTEEEAAAKVKAEAEKLAKEAQLQEAAQKELAAKAGAKEAAEREALAAKAGKVGDKADATAAKAGAAEIAGMSEETAQTLLAELKATRGELAELKKSKRWVNTLFRRFV